MVVDTTVECSGGILPYVIQYQLRSSSMLLQEISYVVYEASHEDEVLRLRFFLDWDIMCLKRAKW